MTHYLDTSALAKLVLVEQHSAALRRWIGATERSLVTGDLARTELLRAVRREAPDKMVAAREVLDAVTVLTLPTSVFERAAAMDPAHLRSLDALHIATAVRLEDDLAGIVTYDRRMAEAAQLQGIPTLSPS